LARGQPAERPAGNRDGIPALILGIGEDIAVCLVYGPELEPVFGASGAEGLDVLDVEAELDDRLAAAFLPPGRRMQRDVGAAILLNASSTMRSPGSCIRWKPKCFS
jgi:hypothetical protein